MCIGYYIWILYNFGYYICSKMIHVTWLVYNKNYTK